jgi:hypothetical protein
VQVGHQKQPLFLLDQPARVRAQLLSIGRESGHLQAMHERWKDGLRRDAETVRRGEAEISDIDRRLGVLDRLDGIGDDLRDAADWLARLRTDAAESDRLDRRLADLRAREAGLAALQREAAALAALPDAAPDLEPGTALEALAGRLRRLDRASPPVPELREPPDLADAAAPAAVLATLGALAGAVAAGQEELAGLGAELRAVAAKVEGLLARTGHVCPLCSQPVPGASHLLEDHVPAGGHG